MFLDSVKPLFEVEKDSFARSVLAARQTDGLLPACPLFEDIIEFDPAQHPELLSASGLTGGFPCQAPC